VKVRSLFAVFLVLVVGLSLVMFAFVPKASSTVYGSSVIYSSYSDGIVWSGLGANYNALWISSTGYPNSTDLHCPIGQIGGSSYGIYRAFLFFDTSTLPEGATIESASLSLYGQSDSSTQDFNVTIQIGETGSPPIYYPHDPLVAGDYYKGHYSGDGGSWNSSAFVASYFNITLNSVGRSYINVDGTTKLTLRSSRDISGTQPTTDEQIEIWMRDRGETYAPKLYVNYKVEGWHIHVYGPYFENGLLAPNHVNVTLSLQDSSSSWFVLDGSDGAADLVMLNCSTLPITLTWNITNPATNKTRTYFVYGTTYEDVYIFLPNPDEPYYLYTFTVTDFAGLTNGYLETIINVNGTNRIVERYSLNVINQIPFWMTWSHRYQLRLVADQGTYNYGSFIALNTQEQQIIITKDMFPIAQPGMNVTVSALRKNATWIQLNYTDSQSLTVWLHVNIETRSGYGYVSIYSTNNTGQTQQVNWYSAHADLDYLVVATALRSSQETWSFSLHKLKSSSNPWDGLLDILGSLPFPVKYLIGFLLLLAFAGCFSFIHTAFGCVIMVIIAGLLNYLGWLDIPVTALGMAASIAVMYVIYDAKKGEREV
jgi:hypothetical protein